MARGASEEGGGHWLSNRTGVSWGLEGVNAREDVPEALIPTDEVAARLATEAMMEACLVAAADNEAVATEVFSEKILKLALLLVPMMLSPCRLLGAVEEVCVSELKLCQLALLAALGLLLL